MPGDERASEDAAGRLLALVEEGATAEAEEMMGETDCRHGCVVEPDGHCAHGWEAAGLTARVI